MGRLGKTHVQVGLVCAGLLLLTALGTAQRGGGSGNVASPIFTALDTNKDGSIARDEMRTTM